MYRIKPLKIRFDEEMTLIDMLAFWGYFLSIEHNKGIRAPIVESFYDSRWGFLQRWVSAKVAMPFQHEGFKIKKDIYLYNPINKTIHVKTDNGYRSVPVKDNVEVLYSFWFVYKAKAINIEAQYEKAMSAMNKYKNVQSEVVASKLARKFNLGLNTL